MFYVGCIFYCLIMTALVFILFFDMGCIHSSFYVYQNAIQPNFSDLYSLSTLSLTRQILLVWFIVTSKKLMMIFMIAVLAHGYRSGVKFEKDMVP